MALVAAMPPPGGGIPIQVRSKDLRNMYRPDKLYETSFIETLDDMPSEEYEKLFKGRIKSAIDHRRRDTFRIDTGGVTVPKGIKAFFNIAIDGDAKTANGVAYVKDKSDTNMIEANKLEYGTTLIIESVQLTAVATSREFGALVAGEPSDLSPAAPATDIVCASNTVVGLGLNCNLEFRVGDELKTEGLLVNYPSENVFTGSFGADAQEGLFRLGAVKRAN